MSVFEVVRFAGLDDSALNSELRYWLPLVSQVAGTPSRGEHLYV